MNYKYIIKQDGIEIRDKYIDNVKLNLIVCLFIVN